MDNVLSSHINKKVSGQFGNWAQRTYGRLKKVSITRGKVHEFLGMTLDFSFTEECYVQ